MSNIICVKISQRRLKYPKGTVSVKYHVFPYDRVYLVPKELNGIAKRLFRYSFTMPLDRDLVAALSALSVAYLSELPVKRIDNKPLFKFKDNPIKNIIQDDFLNWNLVVPTSIRVIKDSENARTELRYIVSRAVTIKGVNGTAKMPPIVLSTPRRITPMCSVCANLPAYYAGDCEPGRSSCHSNADIRFPLDQLPEKGTP